MPELTPLTPNRRRNYRRKRFEGDRRPIPLEQRGVALLAGLGASEAGFAAGGAPGMAIGALSPAVGYLAKKAADRMTIGTMDTLGDLARGGGNASALQAPPNAGAKRGSIGCVAAQRGNRERVAPAR